MKPDKPKIGAGHLSAFMRQGLRELRNALYPSSNVAQQYPELGLYGTRTPGEVQNERKAETRDIEEEHGSALARHMEKARERQAPERDDRDIERE